MQRTPEKCRVILQYNKKTCLKLQLIAYSRKIRHEYYVTAGYPNIIISAFLQSVKQYGKLAIPKGGNDTSVVRGVSSFVAVQLRSSPFRDVALHRLIYLLTAIGLSPGGSSTVHIYTQTIHRTTKKQTIHRTTQQFGRVRAVPRLG